MLETDTEHISELLAAATPEAAASLSEIAETTKDKETRKAARRALYRLSQSGIVPPETRSTGAAPARAAQALAGPSRALASAFDGAGNRLLLLVMPDPDGGSPTLLQILMSDEEGVRSLDAQRLSRVELQDRLARFHEQLDLGLAFAETEIDYARGLLAEFRAINQLNRTATPVGFLDWLPRLGSVDQVPTVSPVYQRLPAEEVLADTSVPHAAEDLFNLLWFQAWFLDDEPLWPWIQRLGEVLSSQIEVPEHVKKERTDRVIAQAAEAILDDTLRARYARRLEETADILQRRGKDREARQALYHALQLKSDRPIGEVPFAHLLVARSIAAVVQMAREQEAEQDRNRPIERPYAT